MIVNNEKDMREFGEKIGSIVSAGDIIELIGDVGAGKTTFVHGLAKGMQIDEQIQSPSFTISRTYDSAKGLKLAHYDFYRLSDPGIMADELIDNLGTENTVIVIEWATAVESILSIDRLSIFIKPDTKDRRLITIKSGGTKSERLRSALK
ncbi:MAG: tRNA (adenosine(37)-N6)-threonylcarbamoyltransferase complex ATPase subunit type 1 TsaE [Candidatus Saccharimonadales bacterium]